MKISNEIQCILRPLGLRSFINSLSDSASILDIGCGNESSKFYKSIYPNLTVDGIDIQDYNQTFESKFLYRNYIISKPNEFSESISSLGIQYDAIISNHNLEHCNNPAAVLEAMIKVLRVGGVIFIATPSKKSLNFPSRIGTLNFNDDVTHREPISLDFIKLKMISLDMKIYKLCDGYQPTAWRIIGFLMEPISFLKRKVLLGTWDYWGFELILWVKKE